MLAGELAEGTPESARFLVPATERSTVKEGAAGERLLRYVVLSYPPETDLAAVKKTLAEDSSVEWVGENFRTVLLDHSR